MQEGKMKLYRGLLTVNRSQLEKVRSGQNYLQEMKVFRGLLQLIKKEKKGKERKSKCDIVYCDYCQKEYADEEP